MLIIITQARHQFGSPIQLAVGVEFFTMIVKVKGSFPANRSAVALVLALPIRGPRP